MTVELKFLVLTAILTGCLWVPVVIGYMTTRGFLTRQDYIELPEGPLPNWVQRANRAHINAIENFAVFAVIVIVAHLVEVSTPLTQQAALVYFWARVAHAAVYISGFRYFMARTVIFGVGWLAFIVYAVELMSNA